jgi:hypothetical protein
MDLILPIAVNVVLGLALLALFAWVRWRELPGLGGSEEALRIFREHFPEASGTASVSVDGRSALFELAPGPQLGLLHRNGRRWNARELSPGDLRSVKVRGDDIVLSFTDFGWGRITLRLPEVALREQWLARLAALADRPPVATALPGAGRA